MCGVVNILIYMIYVWCVRSSVLNAMIFCLDHSEYALEIVECLMESLTIEKTPIDTKVRQTG